MSSEISCSVEVSIKKVLLPGRGDRGSGGRFPCDETLRMSLSQSNSRDLVLNFERYKTGTAWL